MFKQALLTVTLCLSSASAFAQNAPAPAARPQAPAIKTHLKVGDMAPDFELPGTDGKTHKLSSFRGQKNVVVAVYFFAFTGG
jgi:cytochrome oxidase Cu insertion factor (SCO1/SenC/PrrC family)